MSIRLRADVLCKKADAAGDITTIAIARRAGVDASTVSRLIAGETTPTVATLLALGDAYQISLDDLVLRPSTEAQAVPA